MERIGPYEVLGELARGGMGMILHARDPRARREVAIKVQYRTNARAARRFRTEGEVLTRLRHPNLVPVLDVGEHGGGVYLVLEFVKGENLAELIEGGALEPRRAARITQALAEGLDHVHQHGVLHRDVKPANVILTGHGVPRLTDFGLAKDLAASAEGATTQEGAFLGTPGFVPPEQAVGDLDRIGPASDIYGLGATFYALLTGQPPYDGDSLLDIVASMQEPPMNPTALRPDVDAALADLCLKCLALEPSQRPESARAVSDALEIYLRSSPLHTKPAWPLVAAGVLGAGFALGLGVWAVTAGGTDDATADRGDAIPTSPPEAVPVDGGDPKAKAERARTLRLTGTALAKLGDTKEALAQFVEACRLVPDDPELWALQAELLTRLGRRTEAIAAYTQTLNLDPKQTAARYNRGVARHATGDLPGAIKDFRQVLEEAPDMVAAWDALGLALDGLDRTEEAIDAFTEGLRLVPGSPRLLIERARAKHDSDPRGALEDLDAAIRLDSRNPAAYFHRAVLKEDLGDPEAALRDYTQAIERGLNSSVVHYNRGLLHEANEDHEAALADYTTALKIAPRDARTLVNRGVVLRRTGKVEAAIRDYTAAVEAEPGYVNGWIARAQARFQQEEWKGAEADFSGALELSPDQPQLLYNRGLTRFKQKDDAGARRDLERALSLFPPGEDRLAPKCRRMLEKLEARSAE